MLYLDRYASNSNPILNCKVSLKLNLSIMSATYYAVILRITPDLNAAQAKPTPVVLYNL